VLERPLAVAMIACSLACSPADDAAIGADSNAVAPTVTVTASDYSLQGPDTIAAGFTSFRLVNHGNELHMAQLIKIEGGKTFQDFLGAYDQAFRSVGRRPDWAPRRGGPGVADPHGESNAAMELEPGNYAWICLMNIPDGVPHIVKHRMAKPFVVVATGPSALAAPRANIVARLTDYAFELDKPLVTGRQTIRVENAGAEPHEIGLVKLAPSKTIDDLRAWLRKPDGPPPMSSSLGGVSSMAPNTTAFFDANLTPGDYALICVVTAPDGRSHIEHGMIRHVRVR
jgi:hypothetical protein